MDIIGQHLGKIIDLIAHLQEERKEKLKGKVRQSWTWQRDLGLAGRVCTISTASLPFLFLIKCVVVILQAYEQRKT